MSDNPTNDSNNNEINAENNPENYTPIDERNEEAIHGNIRIVDVDKEMRSSYLDYAMSVIVGRALPDVRDGMKPVHRRVIYAMFDGGYRPDRGYNKCARVVGDVMGKYHPHGDSAIYETMVRMVQEWTMRYPMIDGQGNFGSESEPKAAAPRYTECRMAKLSMELVRDIEKDTVNFEPNYDGKDMEPTVLPSRYPNLLVNGSSGIAVGMATNIPPHNLREVAKGVIFCIDNKDMSKEELLENLIQIIPGPDFPTGGTIYGMTGINSAYKTGRGIVKMRAKMIEEEERNRTNLVVTELPYQVKPDQVLQRIVQVHKEGIIDGISSVDDFSSGRTGLRIVIGLKKDANTKVVRELLFKHTQLQESFGCNMLALVDGVPRTLSLDAFIRHFVEHQIEVIIRRAKWMLNKAQERAHILEGYLKALGVIDEVIAIIKSSKDKEEAKNKLIDFLTVDALQADAILELRLHRLAALEYQKIQDEFDELQRQIADYNDIISSDSRQRTIIKEELSEIVDKFGDDRRTEIVPGELDQNLENLIPQEDIVITISKDGYIKRTPLDEYRSTHRGGKGLKGVKLRDEDKINHFLVQSTHDFLLLFTNQGRVFRVKGYEVPTGSRDTKGNSINNLIELGAGEKIQEVLNINNYSQKQYLVLGTKQGVIKKSLLQDYNSNRTGGLKAINLKIDEETGLPDELISAKLVNDNEQIIIISKNGMSVKFAAEGIRSMGRSSSGNIGMRFKASDDEVVSIDIIELDNDNPDYIITVTNQGYAKRSEAESYRLQSRGGKGVKVASFDDKRGHLAGGVTVKETDELLALMSSGMVVRSKVSEIPVKGRTAMGVIFAKPNEKDQIIKITKTSSSIEADQEDEISSSNESENTEENNA